MSDSQDLKVDVLLGPGTHLDDLLQGLEEGNLLHHVVQTWPRFSVERFDKTSRQRVPIYNARWFSKLEWLVWAVWRRIPLLGRSESPRQLFFELADRLTRKHISDCDLFIGWTQLCLHSLRHSKARGAVTVLEHPMVHVDTWTKLVEKEYADWGATHGAYSRIPPLLARRMKREYETADYITVLSDFARQSFVSAGTPANRVLQTPLGVNQERFKPAQRRDDIFRVLYVGRIELLKGIQYLLKAFQDANLPNAELCLVGPVMPEMKPVLERFTSPSIRITGAVSREDLVEIYQQGDVFVFPTTNDAFGLVLIEAMASGLPIIATPNSVAPEAIDHGVEGYLVPIRSPEAIREQLCYLQAHPEVRAEMGRAARARVLSQYTIEHYTSLIAKTYSHLLHNRLSAQTEPN